MEKTYIRIKDIPPNELSKNWDTGVFEEGTSVWPGIKNEDGTIQILLPRCQQTAAYTLYSCLCGNKYPIYEVEGEEVGIGGTGEPLLKNIVIIKELKITKEGKLC